MTACIYETLTWGPSLAVKQAQEEVVEKEINDWKAHLTTSRHSGEGLLPELQVARKACVIGRRCHWGCRLHGRDVACVIEAAEAGAGCKQTMMWPLF